MRNKKIIFAILAVTAAAVWAFAQAVQDGGAGEKKLVADAANAEMVALGKKVYGQYCAKCHGENLEGQPNWRKKNPDGTLPAPPHDAAGHTWHHADAINFKYTKFSGREFDSKKFKSAMPSFKEILSDVEILSVLTYIKSQWPQNIQAKHKQINEREMKGGKGR